MCKKNDEYSELRWKPMGRKNLLSTPVFKVDEIESMSPDSNKRNFISLEAPNWVIVVPEFINADGIKSFLMVHQWRHGASDLFKEFPGGVIDPGETPEVAAKRELLEETGRTAMELVQLAEIYTNPAIMQNICYVFFAKCSQKAKEQNLDENEFIEILEEPVNDVLNKIGIAPYNHALMSTALMQYIRYKNSLLDK